MVFKIEMLKEAEIEFNEALSYYNNISIKLVQKLKMEFYDYLRFILEHPKSFPQKYKNLRRANLSIFPYSIFYLIKKEEIVIVSFFHQNRDPKIWKK